VHGVGIEFFPANETHFHFTTIDVPVETAIFPNLGFNATLPPTNQSTVTWNGALNGTMNEIGNASDVIIQGGLWVTNRAHFIDFGENGEVYLFDVTVDGRYYHALILRGGDSLDYWNQNTAAKDASIFFETQSLLTYQQAEAIKESMASPIFQTILSEILWKDRNALQIPYTFPEHDADIAAAKELAVGTYHFQSTYVDKFYSWIDQVTPKPLVLPKPAWYEQVPWSWILGGIVGTVCYEIVRFPLRRWYGKRKSLSPTSKRETQKRTIARQRARVHLSGFVSQARAFLTCLNNSKSFACSFPDN
jgi:hypothetical protein